MQKQKKKRYCQNKTSFMFRHTFYYLGSQNELKKNFRIKTLLLCKKASYKKKKTLENIFKGKKLNEHKFRT